MAIKSSSIFRAYTIGFAASPPQTELIPAVSTAVQTLSTQRSLLTTGQQLVSCTLSSSTDWSFDLNAVSQPCQFLQVRPVIPMNVTFDPLASPFSPPLNQ